MNIKSKKWKELKPRIRWILKKDSAKKATNPKFKKPWISPGSWLFKSIKSKKGSKKTKKLQERTKRKLNFSNKVSIEWIKSSLLKQNREASQWSNKNQYRIKSFIKILFQINFCWKSLRRKLNKYQKLVTLKSNKWDKKYKVTSFKNTMNS